MAQRAKSDPAAQRCLDAYVARTYPDAEEVAVVRGVRTKRAYRFVGQDGRERYLLPATTNESQLTARKQAGDSLLFATTQTPGVVFEAEIDEDTSSQILRAEPDRQDGYCHV